VTNARGTLHPRTLEALHHLPDLVSRMQAQDSATYLPDDILTKVDRCSMAVALEAREPLLDHRLIEFVWSLPVDIHRGGQGNKGLLREVLSRYVPRAMTDRPKRGFSIPLAEWLRGPLRGWADDLLSSSAIANDDYLDAAGVRMLWQRHLDRVEDNATGLWNILMFRAWSERWLKP
jgi:asparagine synthase (glutamine-hydrolysing)